MHHAEALWSRGGVDVGTSKPRAVVSARQPKGGPQHLEWARETSEKRVPQN